MSASPYPSKPPTASSAPAFGINLPFLGPKPPTASSAHAFGINRPFLGPLINNEAKSSSPPSAPYSNGSKTQIPVAAGVGGQRTTTIRDLVSKTSLVVAIVESLKAVSSASSAEVSSRLSTLIRTIEGIPRTTMLPDATKTALVDYSSSNAAVFSDVLARWKGFLDDKAASVKKIRDSAQKLKEVEVLINSFESTYSSFVSMSNPRSLGWGGVSPATSDASKNRMKVNMIGILNDITEKIGGIDDISIDPRDFSPAPDHIVMDDDVIFTQYQRQVRNLKASLLVANKELATALANADKPYKLRDITERNGGSNKESGDIYQLLSPDTFVSLVKEPLDATANLVRDGTNKMKDELLTIVDRQNKTKGPAGGDNIGVLQQHIEDLTYIFEATKDLQYVGLLLDVDEVVSKLKKFLEVAKNKQGVMDRLKIEDLGSYKETTSSSADAPKSIFDEYNKTPSRTRNPTWIKKSGGLMHRRIDDEFLDTYVNQLSGFYEKISENKLISGGIENAKGQLISRLSGLDKQASLDRTKNDGTMFLNMQSAREMKVAAYKSYISTLQNILNTFIEENTSFILEQHRDALAYVMYWDEKMQQNPEIGDELCRKLVTMYLETRDKIVDYINESVIQVIISDVDNTLVVTTNVTNGAMIVRLDEKQEKMVMKLFGNFIDLVEKKGNWIVDLHIRGTLSWVDVLMSQVFLLSYVIKVVRVFFMWMSLRFAYFMFQRRIESDPTTSYSQNPPSPMYFVAFFLLFDFVFNALLFVVLFIVDWLLSDPVDPMIKRNLWVAIMVDYCVSNVVMSILAVSIGLVVKDKRFFRYRYDPLIGIRAMKDILFNTFIVVLSIPFFRLIVE